MSKKVHIQSIQAKEDREEIVNAFIDNYKTLYTYDMTSSLFSLFNQLHSELGKLGEEAHRSFVQELLFSYINHSSNYIKVISEVLTREELVAILKSRQ